MCKMLSLSFDSSHSWHSHLWKQGKKKKSWVTIILASVPVSGDSDAFTSYGTDGKKEKKDPPCSQILSSFSFTQTVVWCCLTSSNWLDNVYITTQRIPDNKAQQLLSGFQEDVSTVYKLETRLPLSPCSVYDKTRIWIFWRAAWRMDSSTSCRHTLLLENTGKVNLA